MSEYIRDDSIHFRALTPADVECRIQKITQSGVSLLIYKNARCDMRVLDETVGPLNWQRTHSRDNANCVVSIWDASKQQWINKEDTGTESNAEAEKGLCSDSFKRACTNWGIGRELYTAPHIWIPADKCALEDTGKKDKYGKPILRCKARFDITEMNVEDGRIVGLEITACELPAFRWGKLKPITAQMPQKAAQKAAESRSLNHTQPQTEGHTQPAAAANDAIVCADCGKPIGPVKRKDGSIRITAEQVAQKSSEKYGRPLCTACARKARGEVNNA